MASELELLENSTPALQQGDDFGNADGDYGNDEIDDNGDEEEDEEDEIEEEMPRERLGNDMDDSEDSYE